MATKKTFSFNILKSTQSNSRTKTVEFRIDASRQRMIFGDNPNSACHMGRSVWVFRLVGVMIWQSAPDRLQFVMSRSDVYSRNRDVFQHRKPIGHCKLRFASTIRGGAARLDIFRAEALFELEFADAPLRLKVICHALDDTLIVEADRDLQQAE